MKKIATFFILFILAVQAFSQQYVVTHIAGTIQYNGNLLKAGDKINGTDHLIATGRTAEIGFLTNHGRKRIRFQNGKPVNDPAKKAEHSELYELTVGDFIENYTTQPVLGRKGVFDFFEFVSDSTGNPQMRLMIMQGECISVHSAKAKIYPEDKFYLCFFRGRDTLPILLNRTPDSLCFDNKTLAGYKTISDTSVPCIIRINYVASDGSHAIYSLPLLLNMPSKKEVEKVVQIFSEQFSGYYQGDKLRLYDDLKNELFFDYGRFDEDIIAKMMDKYLLR